MSLKCEQDLMRETARLFENAVFGTDAQPPCYLYFEESIQPDAKRLQELEAELLSTQANLTMLNDTFKQEIEAVRADGQEQIAYLRKENEKKDAIITRLIER